MSSYSPRRNRAVIARQGRRSLCPTRAFCPSWSSGGFAMPEQRPRVYWDANVLLSFINGAPDRLPDVETLLLEAEKDTIELLTSALSIVEVAFGAAEQNQHKLDEETKQRIDKLWVPTSPIKLVEF